MLRDEYRQIETPLPHSLTRCPVCSGRARLWLYSAATDMPVRYVAMCTDIGRFGEQTGEVNIGCILTQPPDDFYRETSVDAVIYWNRFATDCLDRRIERSQ